MRTAVSADVSESIGRASVQLSEGGMPLAVTREDVVVGWLTESRLATAMLDGADPSAALDSIELEVPVVLGPAETVGAALRQLSASSFALVCDVDGRLLGAIVASDLLAQRHERPRPPMVGGMATPFGVYLTTGGVSGGAPKWALMTTGALMFLLLQGSVILSELLGDQLLNRGLAPRTTESLISGLALIGFLLLIRLLPLSGTHGAEHQVVHAIEREERLLPSIVRRMPRVHPRCGTNLAAGASLFLGLFQWNWTSDQELRLLVSGLITVLLYRRLGGLVQLWITTRRPNDKQLGDGIKAGEELLKNFLVSGKRNPSVLLRLWNSGFFHVTAGAWIAAGISSGLKLMFNVKYGL